MTRTGSAPWYHGVGRREQRRPAVAVHESFGNLMDASHTGRIGDTLTLTGRLVDEVALELRGHSIYFPEAHFPK